PARHLRQLLADRRVREDVHGRHGCARRPQRLERPARVAAHHELWCALHEQHDLLVLDHVLDPFAQLGHVVPLVLIRSSWMVPSRSGSASASLTSRCCSSSGKPSKRGLSTVTWKWSPPPVRSSTRSSAASGNAPRNRDSSRSTATAPWYCAPRTLCRDGRDQPLSARHRPAPDGTSTAPRLRAALPGADRRVPRVGRRFRVALRGRG